MWLAIKLATSKVWAFLLPIIKIFMSSLGPILAAAAEEAVRTFFTADMTNDEKRAAAFSKIMEDLSKQGIAVKASVINTAIEIALQKIKDAATPTA
jgi:hypothetical protein